MTKSQDSNTKVFPTVEEIPERLDEQHVFTTKTLGFLVHPNIPLISPTLKIADIGTGTGIWLLDVAKSLPQSCKLVGFDMVSSAFPPPEKWPANVSFQTQDMTLPFPPSDLGTYDIVAVRFISTATPRKEWICAIDNLVTLLKPGGWLQWIDSCNFALYNSTPGTSRAACQQIYDELEPLREKEDTVIGMAMRERGNARRVDIWKGLGLLDVHEDVFSTDRLQDPELNVRDKSTRNAIMCFLGCLEGLGWSKERIDKLKEEAMREIDRGVYHTLDQVCLVGRKV